MNEKEYLELMMNDEELNDKMTPKQAKILEAAIEMFSEKGYAATSTSEIAKKANVAEGTIFRHYKTKKDLLMGIITPMLTRFTYPFIMSHFVQAVFKDPHKNYQELIETIIYNRFEFVKKNSSLVKIVLQEIAFHPEITEAFGENFRERVYPNFIEAIERFKQNGELIDYPTETIFRLTVTTIVGFLITRFIILPEQNWDDEVEIKRIVRFLTKGLAAD